MVNNYLQNKLIMQKELAKIIKDRRMSVNKSITLISAEVGMTKSMWADMEKGKKDPQLSTFLRIAEGLEVRPEDLIKELFENLSEDFSLIE